MKVYILAGGKGTRMGSLTDSIPKPMALLAGKPILEHQIELIKRYNLSDVIMLTGYKGEVIEDYFNNGKKWGINIEYFPDSKPLGTAGSVKELEKLISEPFLLLYGDTMIDINLSELITFHKGKRSISTLVVHPNDHPNDSDLLDIDANNYVTKFFPKPHKKGVYKRNLVNAALYILSPKIFRYIEKGKYSDFGKDVFPRALSKKQLISAYNTTEYIKDIGTPDRLAEVEKDYLSGKLQHLNKSNRQKAIFIDRDGVINKEADPLDRIDKLKILPGVVNAIKKINKSDYLSLIITNQPIVAKGFVSEDQLGTFHNYMESFFGVDGAYFNRIYYCPHHPERGYKGERIDYKILCGCRKPKTGLIKQAVNEMNIDLNQSFIIGDRTVDIMTGVNAKLQTILVRQGYAGKDGKYDCQPDFIFNDLYEATNFVLYNYDYLKDSITKYFTKNNFKDKKQTVIAIGGLSRSGKSTFASIVRKYFYDLSINVTTVHLDNWLLPIDERKLDIDVRERYQYSLLEKDIETLLNGKKIRINKYNSRTRKINNSTDTIFAGDNNVIILDGVIALDNKYIRDISDHTFFIKIDEKKREKRFKLFYKDKSISEKEINNLYRCRNLDEVPIVLASEFYAKKIIEMDF
jgi:mannose-1-phosphate guanylyltransferase / phosphomannomutase